MLFRNVTESRIALHGATVRTIEAGEIFSLSTKELAIHSEDLEHWIEIDGIVEYVAPVVGAQEPIDIEKLYETFDEELKDARESADMLLREQCTRADTAEALAQEQRDRADTAEAKILELQIEIEKLKAPRDQSEPVPDAQT